MGRLQFRFPQLRVPINKIGQLLNRKGPIRRGPAQGLIFDGRGCNPGWIQGTSEPKEQSLLVEHLKPGNVFYDLGANAGFYCLLAGKLVGTTGKVYAFEPTPKLAQRIRENAASNNFSWVEVVEAAVSDEVGELQFGIEGELSIKNALYNADTAANTISVEAVTIDHFARNNEKPDLILIDIEGAELAALNGGLDTIREHMPILMIEVHWLGDKFPRFVNEVLIPMGYHVTTYDGATIPRTSERFHCLCVPIPGRSESA